MFVTLKKEKVDILQLCLCFREKQEQTKNILKGGGPPPLKIFLDLLLWISEIQDLSQKKKHILFFMSKLT